MSGVVVRDSCSRSWKDGAADSEFGVGCDAREVLKVIELIFFVFFIFFFFFFFFFYLCFFVFFLFFFFFGFGFFFYFSQSYNFGDAVCLSDYEAMVLIPSYFTTRRSAPLRFLEGSQS